MLELRLTEASGYLVDFTAEVTSDEGEIPVIAITPDEDLMTDNRYYVEISASVQDMSENVIELSCAIFAVEETSGDEIAPTITFDPHDGETGVAINTMIIITFDEPVRDEVGSEIDNENVSELIELKKDNDSGSHVSFTATINTEKTVITVDPTSNLDYSQYYYVEIEPVEDEHENENDGVNATFRTLHDQVVVAGIQSTQALLKFTFISRMN